MAKWDIDKYDDTFTTQQTYRHKRTGFLYTVLHEGLEVTGDEGIPSVVYQSSSGDIFIQEKSRFFDGRFEKV